MNLNDLEIFEAIIETGSLNKAAKALGYAQSNISARLKSLEHEFHTTLVERSAKGVEPTRIGKRLYRASLRITAELDDVRREAAGAPGDLLITEALMHYMMTNVPSFHPESYGTIVVRRQSNIVPEARRHQYKSVVAFVEMDELDNYRLMSTEVLEAAYLAAEDMVKNIPVGRVPLAGARYDKNYGTSNVRTQGDGTGEKMQPMFTPIPLDVPLLINHDKECAFRKRSLRDHMATRNSRRLMEVDSLETIVTMVEQGKGIALLPSYLTTQRKLRKLSMEPIRLQYRVYGEVE
ncbi:LysR family transcriptional regulator [Bifidobacterium sp. ESL0732]|uniref:LysR family transcriptional regulator n=1 Tax=Bifidobacterium sp. ESL0732 TaxID=2983222 RepID=UPI0023F98AA4|nr:LysR family transcriptional regulator [Bifidobacterium sp. ESL0732]WEV63780.1 LysR family transcriptional regulator [Bifidobacterium sp. ESL0732]